MIVVSVAAVSALIARRSDFGLPRVAASVARSTARTMCGSINRPPLATALTAVAICSGVTLTW